MINLSRTEILFFRDEMVAMQKRCGEIIAMLDQAVETRRSKVDQELVTPTLAEIEAAQTPAGGWTREQLAQWGVPWPPPKGWKKRLVERDV